MSIDTHVCPWYHGPSLVEFLGIERLIISL